MIFSSEGTAVALSAFADKSHEPQEDELRQMLGRTSARWDDLIAHLEAEHGPINLTWNYAGANWGWSLRVKRKKRTILYMTPCERHFLVGFALGERAVAAARHSGLPQATVALIEGARKYAEGRAVRLEIRNKRDLAVAEGLAALKMAN